MKDEELAPEAWVSVSPGRLQWLGRLLTRRPGKIAMGYRTFGSERVPARGGFIIAPNHASYLDGPLFAHGHNRVVRFMAKYEALQWPLVGRLIRRGGGFPVKKGHQAAGKGGNQPALEIARHVLESGHGLVMFMEGKLIRSSLELGEPKSGLALLALWTGVPVIPAAAWGTRPLGAYGKVRRARNLWRFWNLPRTTIVWGHPIVFPQTDHPERELIEAVRDEIWGEVTRLYSLAHDLHSMEPRPPRYDVPLPPELSVGSLL